MSDARLKKAGVSGYNKPKRTPGHKTKSHVVVAKSGSQIKTIRFGQQGKTGDKTITLADGTTGTVSADEAWLRSLYSNPDILNRVIKIELAADFDGRPRSIENKEKNKNQTYKILSVGTVEPRKNHLNLIEAIKIVNNNTKLDFELIIIGNNNFKDLEYRIENEIKSLKNISWIKNVNDQVLVELYKDSYFTVYPSIEEGFGIPIIESLWYGKPCICHNSSASYEVSLGGGCIAIDANKPDEIAGAIINLLESKNLYESKLTELHTRKFKSWKVYASEMIADMSHQPYYE